MSNTPPAIATPKANPRLIFENLLMALAMDVAADAPPPRKHEAPKLPPGVVPEGAAYALDSAPGGGAGAMYEWLNNSTYCGMGFPGYTYLAELQQRSEYRAPVETIANEMTRKWVQFKGADEKKLKELTTAFEKFAVREKFRLAAIHDGGQGRGMLFIDIAGQDSPEAREKPLKIAKETIKKGSLIGFQNIEPMWSTPYAYNSVDPTSPNFYRPEAWYIMGRRTHADRLLTFISRPVPDILKPSYNFGGLSLTQLVQPYVTRWLKTVDSVNRLLSNFSMTYLKTDMEGTLAGTAGANESLVNRLRVFAALKDNRGIAAIDKDSEEFEQINTPLSGLSELQAQAQEHMAAPTHIPLVFLTGITPSGLNASSEGEIKVFYNWISGEQENFFEGNLRVVFELIQLHLWGDIDDSISFEWVPLDSATDVEQGVIRKDDAAAGASYVTAGVISPDEERERLRMNPDSGYTHITGPAPTPKLDDEAALAEAGKQLDHERGQEDAETAHERALEMAREEAKNKPAGATDETPPTLAWWRRWIAFGRR
jgi:phage-related protein (TIGR01555 family)